MSSPWCRLCQEDMEPVNFVSDREETDFINEDFRLPFCWEEEDEELFEFYVCTKCVCLGVFCVICETSMLFAGHHGITSEGKELKRSKDRGIQKAGNTKTSDKRPRYYMLDKNIYSFEIGDDWKLERHFWYCNGCRQLHSFQ